MTMTYVLKLAFLTESMNELLPEGTQRTIGLRYQALDQNLYQNVFLQKMLSDVPEFQDQLNLKAKRAKLTADSDDESEIEEFDHTGQVITKKYKHEKKQQNLTLN